VLKAEYINAQSLHPSNEHTCRNIAVIRLYIYAIQRQFLRKTISPILISLCGVIAKMAAGKSPACYCPYFYIADRSCRYAT